MIIGTVKFLEGACQPSSVFDGDSASLLCNRAGTDLDIDVLQTIREFHCRETTWQSRRGGRTRCGSGRASSGSQHRIGQCGCTRLDLCCRGDVCCNCSGGIGLCRRCSSGSSGCCLLLRSITLILEETHCYQRNQYK